MTAIQNCLLWCLAWTLAFSAMPCSAKKLGADVTAPSVKSLFEGDQTNQFVLDVEAALARAQAAHGVIPQEAAAEITRKANVQFAPLDEIAAERKIVQHRMVALINVWRRALPSEARGFVHYGATTVDIYDTALTLQLRRSTQLLIGRLRHLEALMIEMAVATQDAVMPGRTLGQHALPITFGKKVSTWIGENRRNIERLKGVLAELERSAILKGAVGTYAGLGDRAIQVEQSFAAELGLQRAYSDDWHGTRDVYASYALTLALIAKSYGRIGQELFLLQMTDLGETSEERSETAVSSSSMAQKVNPSKSEVLIQGSRAIPRLAEVVLDDVVNFFERDNTAATSGVLAEISIASDENLKVAAQLLSAIEIDREAMRRNFAKSKGFMMAQRVTFALAATLGKLEAEDAIRDLIKQATRTNVDFRTALLGDPAISKILTAVEIDTLLDPAGYIGQSRDGIKAVIDQAEALRLQDPVR